METSRAWTFISVDPSSRQYGGNLGHKEDYSLVYRYDEDVANHLQVHEGDLAFVRDREQVLGVAVITNITIAVTEKVRQRCPVCDHTDIKVRTNKPANPWRCRKGHEFPLPKKETVQTTSYTADYGGTFVSLPKLLSASDLKKLAKRPNDQMSIEEIAPAALLPKLTGAPKHAAEMLEAFLLRSAPSAADADGPRSSSYVPGQEDLRTKVTREILVRRGQRSFRDKLRKRYLDRCVISNCSLLDLLEAAHISPYRGEQDNHPGNGLLLRADLHTLFDLFLIGIDPTTHQLRLHPKVLAVQEYAPYEGKTLFVGGKCPDPAPLEKHWRIFRKGLPEAKSAALKEAA